MTSLKNFKAFQVLPLFLAAFALLSPSTSNATVTLQSITGVSKADPVIAGNTSIKIYGGFAGTGRCPPDSGTCDSCSTVTTLAGLSCLAGDATTACTDYANSGCNNQMIGPNTIIAITFSSTTAGYPTAYGTNTSTTSTSAGAINLQTSGSSVSGVSYAAGTTLTLRMTWTDMCAQAGCDATGATSVPGTFTFGVNPTGSAYAPTDPYTVTVQTVAGIPATYEITDAVCTQPTPAPSSTPAPAVGAICTYQAYPGDSKITVTSPDGENGYPIITGSQTVSALRLYYEATSESSVGAATGDFGTITPQSGYAELPVDSSGNIIGNGRVTGLTNDTVYVFKMAHVDQAGNVGLFTATDSSDTTCATSDTTCHIAQPGAVEGILSKTLNCFVATASYGSTFAPKVQTFRDFRNRFLLHNKWGLRFVEFYYSGFGPKAARFIARSETLRAMSRTALFPVWCFATLSLDIGVPGAILVTFAFFALIALTVRVCSKHLGMDA